MTKKKQRRESNPKAAPPDTEIPGPSDLQPGEGEVITGKKIREVREAKGISLKEIAERTKINENILAALEDERFEDMPNARVYVRGFVRCLAKEIGLDEDQTSRTYVPRWESWFEGRLST